MSYCYQIFGMISKMPFSQPNFGDFDLEFAQHTTFAFTGDS